MNDRNIVFVINETILYAVMLLASIGVCTMLLIYENQTKDVQIERIFEQVKDCNASFVVIQRKDAEYLEDNYSK